jgi:zona occludens toxin
LQKNPYTKTNKALGLPQKIKTNPEVFKMYRSTIMNTRRKEFPWHAVIKMALLCSGLLLAAVFVYWYMLGRHQVDEPVKPSVVPHAVVAPAVPPVASTSTPDPSESESFIDQPLTYKDFIPDNPLMPYTAPAYRDLAKPTDFPRIAACMDSQKTGCKCFTQQYTPVDVPKDSCLRMVKEGWFDNFATGRSQQEQVLSGKPDEVSKRNAERSKHNNPTI